MAAVPASALTAAMIGWGSGENRGRAAVTAGIVAAVAGGLAGSSEEQLAGIVSMAVGGACQGECTSWVARGVANTMTPKKQLLHSLAAAAALEGVRKVLPRNSAQAVANACGKVEGADKVAKGLQNTARLLPMVDGSFSKSGTDAVAQACGSARSILCLGQALRTLPKLLNEREPLLKRARHASTLVFQTSDNVTFAAKHQLFPFVSPETSNLLGRRACLLAYLLDVVSAAQANDSLVVTRGLLDAISTIRSTKLLPNSFPLPPAWVDSAAALSAVSIALGQMLRSELQSLEKQSKQAKEPQR
ncbi:hypothetical protein DIPPA_25901 [Diplonema papillatum]|nr:hypothetical protein DIPPA_25901 [Diplonema papillatum]KAJ9454974.1 hypothetical protein DIPPA_25901 [Diplonema papillatum]